MAAQRSAAPDEMFCSSCGNIVKRSATTCPNCGAALQPLSAAGPAAAGKSKALAIVLAVFFGPWAWLYTYQKDGKKFWIAFVAAFACGFVLMASAVAAASSCVEGATAACYASAGRFAVPILVAYGVSFGMWLWALIDRIAKPGAWYTNYHVDRPRGRVVPIERAHVRSSDPDRAVTTARSIGPDEMFCSNCGNIVKRSATTCPHCGATLQALSAAGPAAAGKSKPLAIVLAVFFGPWTWLYTYQKDGKKFWIAFVITAVVMGIFYVMAFRLMLSCLGGASPDPQVMLSCEEAGMAQILVPYLAWLSVAFALWLWALIDRIAKPGSWYTNYHTVR